MGLVRLATVDIQNANDFFGKKLNYDVFPDYSHTNKNTHKSNWEKAELIKFFQEKATDLENNIRNKNEASYDGLVVVVSCHGIDHHILTSDYKKISKTEIHRIFAVDGESRNIPV